GSATTNRRMGAAQRTLTICPLPEAVRDRTKLAQVRGQGAGGGAQMVALPGHGSWPWPRVARSARPSPAPRPLRRAHYRSVITPSGRAAPPPSYFFFLVITFFTCER